MKQICMRVLVCIALLAGNNATAAEVMDFGTIENSVYRNEFLGMSIKLPEEWIVQDQEARQKLMDLGGNLVAGDDKNRKAQFKASELQSVYLLAAFKHELGAPVPFNPNISCIAERVDNSPGIKQGKDYLFHTRRAMESSQVEVSFPKELSTTKFGGQAFDLMHAEMKMSGMTIRQKYYASIIKGYALVCIESYRDADEEAVLDKVLGSLTFE